MKLIQCKTCGKMFKIPKIIDKVYYTDMNGSFIFNGNDSFCLNCKNFSSFDIIEIEDWIADKVFSVKAS